MGIRKAECGRGKAGRLESLKLKAESSTGARGLRTEYKADRALRFKIGLKALRSTALEGMGTEDGVLRTEGWDMPGRRVRMAEMKA